MPRKSRIWPPLESEHRKKLPRGDGTTVHRLVVFRGPHLIRCARTVDVSGYLIRTKVTPLAVLYDDGSAVARIELAAKRAGGFKDVLGCRRFRPTAAVARAIRETVAKVGGQTYAGLDELERETTGGEKRP